MTLKILIVDDEADFAAFIADAVDDLGHSPKLATTPEEFASTYSNDTDIIFLDLFMPGMDGIEVLRFLSENGSNASVVLMSGGDDSLLKAAREIAQERGIAVLGVLRKPIHLASLIDILEQQGAAPRASTTSVAAIDVDDIRRGVEEDEFILFYQPQISLASGAPSGIEALIRWNHPEFGLVSPAAFIPQAERSGLIGPLTEHVIARACRDLSALRENGLSPRMSINLSAGSIYDLELPEKLYKYFGEHSIDPGHVVLELTETAVMSDVAASIDILTRLRMKGFQLSIDDFGIGYSSMEQLVRIPFSELKVDQKFVQGLLKYPECRSVTEVSITLAHKLGLTVVAEGIEDLKTLDELRTLGCEEGQGYVIGHPMPLQQIRIWLSERADMASMLVAD